MFRLINTWRIKHLGKNGLSNSNITLEDDTNYSSMRNFLLEQWAEENPKFRKNEALYIKKIAQKEPCVINGKGDLYQPFTIKGWTFLLTFSSTFPKKDKQEQIGIRVYLVDPKVSDLEKFYSVDTDPCIAQDANGTYLNFPELDNFFYDYLINPYDKCISEKIVQYTIEWVGFVHTSVGQEFNHPSIREISSVASVGENQLKNTGYQRPKYVDGRLSHSGTVNATCKKIVLSNRALIQIFNESQARIKTETGGLLLGHFDDGVWYVIEASDPGVNAVFSVAYHEADHAYQNHVCNVISRTYKRPLVFLGMWHRHPGSMDVFSSTDDQTNYGYAASVQNGSGCISAIVNYDPYFRITFYYAEQSENYGVEYTKIDVEVGDDKILNKEILAIANINDIVSRSKLGV